MDPSSHLPSSRASSGAPNPMFSPASPMQPSSPNTQLTMQLLGGLMQGLDGGFSLPSSAVPVPSNPDSSDPQAVYATNFAMQPPPTSSDSPSRSVLSSPNVFMGSAHASPSATLLEQQIKLQQLQQLHQLQNQIFQQQMALISGTSPVSKSQSMELASQYHHPERSAYTGLPTPGPSTELRPQQHSMEFVSPMILNNNYSLDSESSHRPHHHHAHPHSLTSSPMITSTYHDDTFSQQLPPPMATMDFGPPSHQHNHHHHHHLHRGIASAPEHLAFDIRTGREFDVDVSPLTSPWLGAYGEGGPSTSAATTSSSSSRMRMAAHRRQSTMNNLRVPTTSSIAEEGIMERLTSGNKRTASPSTEDMVSRKKHSPAIGPTLSGAGMFASQASAAVLSRRGGSNSSTSTSSPHHMPQVAAPTPHQPQRTSKSTNSTPQLRGVRRRSKSGVLAGAGDVPMVSQGNGEGVGEWQNQQLQGAMMAGLEDSPSPVDLGGPPAVDQQSNPSPEGGGSDGGGGGNVDIFMTAPGSMSATSRLTPVTPASIMNLGRLGVSNAPSPVEAGGSGGSGSNTPILPTPVTEASVSKRASKSRSGKQPEAPPKPLKTLLPAGGFNSRFGGTNDLNPPQGPKKTSHKVAEQKRRDSLKTTFDDLRKLLPQIAFEDVIEEEGPSGGAMLNITSSKSKGKDKVMPIRGPLLPGALPPRGPPKTGGDGPNKGVSKLQLLICGNQYIRTLKGRVERRDEEIAKLRKEVARLRTKVGTREVGEEGEELDLEKDLDAVEGMGVRIGLVAGGCDDDDDEDM